LNRASRCRVQTQRRKKLELRKTHSSLSPGYAQEVNAYLTISGANLLRPLSRKSPFNFNCRGIIPWKRTVKLSRWPRKRRRTEQTIF